MQEFKFNYCIPREYKDKENGEIKYCLCRGGEKMDIDTLENIQKKVNPKLPKAASPWVQVFNNGYRVTHDNLNWEEWNGFTFIDIDSKLYYKNVHPFNVEKLLDAITNEAQYRFNYNFYAVHLSNSKLGYRIFWYWNCEKKEDNFKKCCILTEQYTKELFYSFGDQAKEIIDYREGRSKVLDSCSRSIFQGTYVTNTKIYYSEFINDDNFGGCILDDIDIEGIYKNTIEKICINQNEHCNISNVNEVDKSNIKYYPHQHRRCIYEALIVLFKDKKQVDTEWKRIAELLPEQNGHKKSFYLEEPDKNGWYEKINNNIKHSLSWLDDFGYEYKEDDEYIYYRQFRKSWKKYINKQIKESWINYLISIYEREHSIKWLTDLDDKYQQELISKWREKYNRKTIFDDVFEKDYSDQLINDNRYLNNLDEYRKSYYKTRWNPEEFQFLCNGYEIAKDLVTYKMYADFYYRDKDNLPTIKYNILEDDIQVLGYWPETNKIQYHTYKYGNEYTHWKNNDTFSNKALKGDILEAVNKFVPRWFNYHSIKDYLNSLDLDKADEELLETWAIRYFKCDDTKLTREICKKFFIAAVKKQMVEDPTSFVFQHMLFLQGPTGCGKTFFLVNMFTINGHSYILNKIDPNGKDNEIGPLIAKNWLIQFGESENLKKISVNAAKEFLDRINLGMKYQKKYENEQTTIYPRIMACRTSNDDVLFNDISISEGDRRNWLLVCKSGVNACDENMRKLMRDEKDILWATAYKLYLDDPNQELELSNDTFDDLAALQEEYKLVPTSDIEELYSEIFDRRYLTNNKGEIEDEYSFENMLLRSDNRLNNNEYYADTIQDNSYACEVNINKIPAKWLSNYVKKKYSINHMKLLKKYMLERGWLYKQAGYGKITLKCYIKEGI